MARTVEELKSEIRNLNQIVDLQLVEIERLRARLSCHAKKHRRQRSLLSSRTDERNSLTVTRNRV